MSHLGLRTQQLLTLSAWTSSESLHQLLPIAEGLSWRELSATFI